jgi:hypothetical protein
MQQIIENLKQSLLDQHVPNEQIQNIMNSVDVSQINLQDFSATQEYLSQLLGGFNLQEDVINQVNAGLFGNLGINNIPGFDENSGDEILGQIGNAISGIFGG